MNGHYSVSYEFLKIRDSEDHRHFETRINNLIQKHGLTEEQCELLLFRIDIELSMSYDLSPFDKEDYTPMVDKFVELLLDESTDRVRDIHARVSETIVLQDYY